MLNRLFRTHFLLLTQEFQPFCAVKVRGKSTEYIQPCNNKCYKRKYSVTAIDIPQAPNAALHEANLDATDPPISMLYLEVE